MESLICDHPGRVAAHSLAGAQANLLSAHRPRLMEWRTRSYSFVYLFIQPHAAVALAFPLRNAARAPRPAMNGRWRGMRFIYASVSHLAHIIDHKNNTLLRYAYTQQTRRDESGVEWRQTPTSEWCVCSRRSMCVCARADKFE